MTEAAAKRKPILLLVEDEPGVRRTLARAFAGDYEIHQAKDGAEGLDKALALRPDVIITDQRMPKMTGIEFLSRVRAELPHTIRVLVTGYTDYGPLVDALNVANVHHYFEKPFHTVDVRTVVDVLQRHNEVKQQRDELLQRLRASIGDGQLDLPPSTSPEPSVDTLISERTRELEESNRALREANHKLRDMAIRDGLTKLFNHRSLMEQIDLEVARSKRYHRQFCLLFIDIDDFKRINDRHGHVTGDQVLIRIAEILLPHNDTGLRHSDFPARYGGEEFCIILPETSVKGGEIKAERIRAAVATLNWDQHEPPIESPITVSVGVAVFPEHGDHTAALLEAADSALYRAKSAGKNRVLIAGA